MLCRRVPGDYEFREGVTFYNADFDPKKSDIGLENTYKWTPFPYSEKLDSIKPVGLHVKIMMIQPF
jgi:hypothetical protein